MGLPGPGQEQPSRKPGEVNRTLPRKRTQNLQPPRKVLVESPFFNPPPNYPGESCHAPARTRPISRQVSSQVIRNPKMDEDEWRTVTCIIKHWESDS